LRRDPLDAAVAGPRTAPARGRGQLVRGLDATAAAAIIVGIIIGSGIFRTPNVVADTVGATGLIFVVYIAAGLLVLMGALCYAELGTMLPKSGGAYIYFREAYGDMPAFLLGWTSFIITQVGSMAAVAVFFGELGGVLFGYGDSRVGITMVAAGAIILLAFTNIAGVRLAGHIQIGFTVFKVAALVAVILIGIYLGRGEPIALTPVFPTEWSFSTIQLIGIAMVPALFAYDGWTNANNVAEEIRDVRRNLPRALILGVLFVMGIYLLANFAYVWALGLDGLRGAGGRTAANVFETAFGTCIELGGRCLEPAKIITLVIFVSLFGSLNGQTISYPRIFYAMAKDGVFFRVMALTHGAYKTPHFAIAAQTVWAILLILFFGTFEGLLNLVIFASFLFYALAALALLVLRVRHPEWDRPYKVPLYPFLPVLFIALSLAFSLNFFLDDIGRGLQGLGLILIGIPFFYIWRAVYGGPLAKEDPTEQASLPEDQA
jgi:basic amino acid/polyamine antiporter, APA family